MKKKSLILVFTTCLMLFITACSSSTDELTSGATSMKKVARTTNSVTLPSVNNIYDIPAYIGALHNASIYAFVDYVRENDLSPYEVDGFTKAMIDTFANNYVETMLFPILDEYVFDMSASTNIVEVLGYEIMQVIDSLSDVDEINAVIQERAEDVYTHFNLEGEDVIPYEVIKEIAIATNTLWGQEWDFSQLCFECPYLNYAPAMANSNGNDDDAEKQKKKEDEIKKADIAGAVEGFFIGLLFGTYPDGIHPLSYAIGNAALQAAVASINEYVGQELTGAAMYIASEQVTPNTYLYTYLVEFHQTDPNGFFEMYGDKFNNIIY